MTRLALDSGPCIWRALRLSTACALCSLWVACSTPPRPTPPPAQPTPAPAPESPQDQAPPDSRASSARAYRRDAAAHLYRLHADRIYQGPLPPMLHAVGVMEVELDGNGKVRRFGWMRAPRHAPAVMAEIERMVRAAAPFPRPVRLGPVVYVDTWLWDRSGRFQLDTLTEGQRDR